MPKIVDALGSYFVTAPNREISHSLEKFFMLYPKNSKADSSGEKGTFLEKNLKEEILLEEPIWINCAKYFEKINPLQKPFKVVSYPYGHIINLKLVCDEEEMDSIQDAINLDKTYIWPDLIHKGGLSYCQVILFGQYAWELSTREWQYSNEEKKLILLDAIDKDRRKIERLRKKFSGVAGEKIDYKRESIPEEVRIYVWRRDNGFCVNCESKEKLEYDHIIPVSKGGGQTWTNVVCACVECNGRKGERSPADAGPIPQTSPTSVIPNALCRSFLSVRSSTPPVSGDRLANRFAILEMVFVGPIPIDTGMPVHLKTVDRISLQ